MSISQYLDFNNFKLHSNLKMYITQCLIILIYFFGSQFEFGDRTIYTTPMYNTINNKCEYFIPYSTLKWFSVLSCLKNK